VSTAQGFLFFLILLGLAAVALRLVSRTAPLVPYPVLLATGGIVIGLVPGLRLPPIGADLILLVFVPGLVFEASLSLDLGEVRRRALPIALLASVGVFLTVLGVGALAHYLLKLGWPGSFLLGAIVAPTDPIAVVSQLRRLRAPAGLEAILDGESLFNDGTGVAVFAAVLGSIVSGRPSVLDASFRFVFVSGAGMLVGVAVGVAAGALLRALREAEVEILVTLVVAYGAYLAADLLHASGVVAVVVAGVMVAWTEALPGREKTTQLRGFWSLLAFVLNAILFLLVGVALPAPQVVGAGVLVLGAYAIMFVSRAVPVYGLLALVDPKARAIPWRWRHMVQWGGLRGGLAVALALSVRDAPGIDPSVPVLAYAMVLLSLVVQGGLLVPVADRLGLRARPLD
jgi:CPA1 family monovalent cation:H+ antiporter